MSDSDFDEPVILTFTERLIEARQTAIARGVGVPVPVPKPIPVPEGIRDLFVNDFARILIKLACQNLSQNAIMMDWTYIHAQYDYGEGALIPDQPLYDAMEELCHKNNIKFSRSADNSSSTWVQCVLPTYVNPLMRYLSLSPRDKNRRRGKFSPHSFLATIDQRRRKTIENLIQALENKLVDDTLALADAKSTGTVCIDIESLAALCEDESCFPRSFDSHVVAYMHGHLAGLGLEPKIEKVGGDYRFLMITLPAV